MYLLRGMNKIYCFDPKMIATKDKCLFFAGSRLKNHKAVSPVPSLGFESLDYSNNVLTTNGTLGHLLSTVSAGTHVSTLQHHTVDLEKNSFS